MVRILARQSRDSILHAIANSRFNGSIALFIGELNIVADIAVLHYLANLNTASPHKLVFRCIGKTCSDRVSWQLAPHCNYG